MKTEARVNIMTIIVRRARKGDRQDVVGVLQQLPLPPQLLAPLPSIALAALSRAILQRLVTASVIPPV